MKLTYSLHKSDFLTYQLYVNSKSKVNSRKRLINQILIPIMYLIFAIYMYLNGSLTLSIIIVILALMWLLLYPKYSAFRLKKYFKKYIDENYQSRIDNEVSLEFDNEHLDTEEKAAQSRIDYSELEKLIELSNHFLIKLKSNQHIIIPKHSIIDQNEFKDKALSVGMEYDDETSWRWK